jgi:hypothetical protein
MIDADNLDDGVLNDICFNMGMKSEDWDDDKKVEKYLNKVKTLNVRDALDKYLTWNGIIGFTDDIIRAIDNIRSSEITGEEIDG